MPSARAIRVIQDQFASVRDEARAIRAIAEARRLDMVGDVDDGNFDDTDDDDDDDGGASWRATSISLHQPELGPDQFAPAGSKVTVIHARAGSTINITNHFGSVFQSCCPR